MEKSRAIELLKLAVPIKALTKQEYSDFIEAINMGMDALEQPTSPDTIDRQAVIKVLECWQKAFKENSHHASASDLSLVVKDIRALSATQPVATDTNVGDKISKFIDGLEEIFADIRERHVDDSVCGLCEYEGAYMGQSGDWCNECPGFDRDDCFKLSEETRKKWTEEIIKALPIDSETLIRTIKNGITATNSNDIYSLGMRNGMRWCKSLIDGAEPKFEDYVMSVDDGKELPSVQPETAKRIVGKSRDGMTLWYQCDMCNEPVDEQDNYCRGCGRRLIDG